MKKLFVSCMIAFMAICSVGAQEVYIGGGFTVGSEDSEFVFQSVVKIVSLFSRSHRKWDVI